MGEWGLVLVLLSLWAAAAWAQTYVLTDLGASVVPTGINERGDITTETILYRNGQAFVLFTSTAQERIEGADESGVAFGSGQHDGAMQAFTYNAGFRWLARQSGFISSVATGKVGGTVWGSGEVREPDGTVRRVPLRWRGLRVTRMDMTEATFNGGEVACLSAWVEGVSAMRQPVGVCGLPGALSSVWWGDEGSMRHFMDDLPYGRAFAINWWGLVGGQNGYMFNEGPELWDLWGASSYLSGPGAVTALGTYQVLGYHCLSATLSDPCHPSKPKEAVWWFWDSGDQLACPIRLSIPSCPFFGQGIAHESHLARTRSWIGALWRSVMEDRAPNPCHGTSPVRSRSSASARARS